MAFYVNAWFYYCNGFTDIQASNSTCDAAGSKRALDFIGANFWDVLVHDAFLYFWLSVFLGWLSKTVWLFAQNPAYFGAETVLKHKKRK